ncbi:MAG: prepilin peptidase [Caldilineaceae bacterium]|nr:prepilin peptidase [Caldilineaceae bacterium]
MTTLALIVFAIVCGWVAGGLANWAADVLPHWNRQPRSQRWHTLLVGPAHHYWTLPWYMRRRGVCPHCGEVLSRRRPIVEIVTGALFGLMAAHWGAAAVLPLGWLYGLFFITVTVIDLEQRRVLNAMLVPAAVFVAAISLLPFHPNPASMILGGAMGFGLFLLLAIIGRGALGMGDVKLAGIIGMMTGYPGVLTALMVGASLGAAVALLLLATRRATRKSTIAYAPYLAMGGLVAIWLTLGPQF